MPPNSHMGALDYEHVLAQYATDIRVAALWYAKLMPGGRECGIDEFTQAGKIAVWNVARKKPEKLGIREYVRAAIRYAIFGTLKEAIPRIPVLHVLQEEGTTVNVIDLLPSHERDLEEQIDKDDLCHTISRNFSQTAADNLQQLLERSRASLLHLNFSEPTDSAVKDRVKLVTTMDLSDEEMFVYAEVLLGVRKRFPMSYVQEHPGQAQKYLTFLLEHLGIRPAEFAQMYGQREETLARYRLASFVTTHYDSSLSQLIAATFPELPPHAIRHRGRWQGIEGLLNAFEALGEAAQKNRKKPHELTREDLKLLGTDHMLRALFHNSIFTAIEFRWPGTYFESSLESRRAKQLWDKLERYATRTT